MKAHPDLQKSIEKDIPKQAARMQIRQVRMNKGKSKWQRKMEELERYMYDPELMRINELYIRKLERKEK